MTEIPYPAPVSPIPPSGCRAWSGPLRSARFPWRPRYLQVRPTPDHASGWLFRFRVIPPLPTWTGPNPPAQDAIRSPRVMLPSVRPCRPHSRLNPPGLLRVPLPSVRAKSGLQGFAPTGSPGFSSLGCGLVVCLRSFGFRLATDTLPSRLSPVPRRASRSFTC